MVAVTDCPMTNAGAAGAISPFMGPLCEVGRCDFQCRRSQRAGELPPVRQVAKLMESIGAKGQVTFGGRLEPDARGFPASAMAKRVSGDWRDPEHVREFASRVARSLGLSVA